MTETEKYKLSTYSLVKILHETKTSKVELVECSLDGEKYIKKTYYSDKRAVFNTIAKIKNEHIPEIYEVFFGEDTIIIEQYIEGETLEEKISKGEVFSKNHIKAIYDDLLDAVDALHRNNIVHRDIKPANIIIKENGEAVLIDFSIARSYSEKRSTDTKLFGTVGYAAPEQFGFSQSDYRTDIYALGVTMKEIANSRNSSKRLYSAISRCTEFDPSRRFQNIDEIRKYLDNDKKIWKTVSAAGLAIAAVTVLCVVLNSSKDEDTLLATSDSVTQKTIQTQVAEETTLTEPEEVQSEEKTVAESEKNLQTQQTRIRETETTTAAHSEPETVATEAEETTDSAEYELYCSRIVRVTNDEEDIPCIRMWEDGEYEAELPLGDEILPVKIAVQKNGSKCTVTVNDETFLFEDTFVPEAYSYQDSNKVAEIVFYDMNGDGILDILPFISDAQIVNYYDGPDLNQNYSVAWCIYSDEKDDYRQADGEMYSYMGHFTIYESSPGCVWTDFPGSYTLENGVLVYHSL